MLSRLNVDSQDISTMMDSLWTPSLIGYDALQFKRAKELAQTIGFQHINDCLHTAIAEAYCQELYTYNKSDFKHIQLHTRLKISIL